MENNFKAAMTKCFFCGKDKEIIINTRLTKYYANKIEEMHGKVINKEPCEECKKLMKQGILLCSVRNGENGENPYRTGSLCVVKEEAIKKIVNKEMFKELQKTRFAFIEDYVWDMLHLPRNKELNNV